MVIVVAVVVDELPQTLLFIQLPQTSEDDLRCARAARGRRTS